MCHAILSMPLIGSVLFFVLPWPIAAPIYLVIVAASALVYFKVIQVMKQPIQVGRETLIGKTVDVVGIVDTPSLARYLVREGGELWSASSTGEFRCGDKAVVKGLEGSRIVLGPISSDSALIPTIESKCH